MEINGKLCFVLFKSFFDANTAREFLQNSSNFKETEKNNFTAKWYKTEEEKDFTDSFKNKIGQIIQKYNENSMKNFQNLNILNQPPQNNYNFYPQNWPNQVPNQINMMNQPNNIMMNDQQMGFNNNNLNNQMKNNNNKTGNNSNYVSQYNGLNGNMMGSGNLGNNPNFGNVNLPNGRKNSTNSNADNEDKKTQQQQNGKFTCRFELQIENDKEFQVARRLIGSKVKFVFK